MAVVAWTAQLNSATPSGQSIIINVTYYLASDISMTNPLGTDIVVVPASLSAANIQKQIVAKASDYRASYNLIAMYQGVTINVP